MLTKPMVRCLIEILKGENTLSKLIKKLNKSKAWIAQIVTKLEQEGFLRKIKSGLKVSYSLSDSQHAQAFRDMYFEKPYFKFEEVLSNFNLQILLAIINEPKPVSYLVKYFKTHRNSLYNQTAILNKHLLIKLQRGNLIFVEKINKKILYFLKAYRNYAPEIQGQVLWKLGNEVLFKTNQKHQIKGSLTGFNIYGDYAIHVRTVGYFCYLPKGKLSKEKVFMHSFCQIGFLETRELELAICFYFKNNMNLTRLKELAIHYDISKKFEEFLELIKLEKKMYEGKLLPALNVEELKETFMVYGVRKNLKMS